MLWDSTGVIHDLGVPSGRDDAYAAAINDAGVIAGNVSTRTGGLGMFIGTQVSGIHEIPYGTNPVAVNINNAGIVVGYDAYGDSEHAIKWTSATGIVDLGKPSQATHAYGVDSDSSGQNVVGFYSDELGSIQAFLWNEGTGMKHLGGLPNTTESKADAINDNRQVVGTSFTTSFTGFSFRATLWDLYGVHDLNDLIDPLAGWILGEATNINENGQIVGWGTFNGAPDRSFLLT